MIAVSLRGLLRAILTKVSVLAVKAGRAKVSTAEAQLAVLSSNIWMSAADVATVERHQNSTWVCPDMSKEVILSVIRSLPPALADTVSFMDELPLHLISVSVVAVIWASTDSSKADSQA